MGHGRKIAVIGLGYVGLPVAVAFALVLLAPINALAVQVAVYYLVRIPVPNLSERIAAGDVAPAIWLGSILIALASSSSVSRAPSRTRSAGRVADTSRQSSPRSTPCLSGRRDRS